jgi:hypothetical protein
MVLTAPERAPITTPSVFIAGSIEMGRAVDWQADFIDHLTTHFSGAAAAASTGPNQITILNPRRADWNLAWKQDITCPEFKEQVEWELEHLAKADVVALYLCPGTMSPISLLELGLYANARDKLVVCCPEGYWRRGNVQVVCAVYGVQLVDTLEELRTIVDERLEMVISTGVGKGGE